jgi:hypothetical protein
MIDVNDVARIVGSSPTKVDTRGWATFWCPFHDDAAQRGKTKRPNFGVNLEKGFWKCLACGAEGGSLYSLADQLLKLDQLPREFRRSPERRFVSRVDQPSRVTPFVEAIDQTRGCFVTSPAFKYTTMIRKLNPYVAAVYGLGYGVSHPWANHDVLSKAKEMNLVMKGGMWMWADSVVYVDPPTNPRLINIRYLPLEFCHRRTFEMTVNHRTWGDRVAPLGAWRITNRTKIILVVEGLFDMLIGAQTVHARGLATEVCVVYTNGAQPSAEILQWFHQNGSKYDFVLVKDTDVPDKHGIIAGNVWEEKLKKAIGPRVVGSYAAPDRMDPDEAFLAGWWPSAI